MSLVAYGTSDESDSEENESLNFDEPTEEVRLRPEVSTQSSFDGFAGEGDFSDSAVKTANKKNSGLSPLLDSLPPPKIKTSFPQDCSPNIIVSKTKNKLDETSSSTSSTDVSNFDSSVKSNMFAFLPPPVNSFSENPVVKKDFYDMDNTSNTERRIKIGTKAAKQPVKISFPSLKEWKDDEEEPTKKKFKHFSSKSGLIDMLPAPRNISLKEAGRKLVPHVLTKKPDGSEKCLSAPDVQKPVSSFTEGLVEYDDEKYSDKEGSNVPVDFFSLETTSKVPEISTNEFQPSSSTYGEASSQINSKEENKYKNTSSDVLDVINQTQTTSSMDAPLSFSHSWNSAYKTHEWTHHHDYQHDYYSNTERMTPTAEQSFLNDEMFLRLQDKKKHHKEEIQFIDVSADQQLPNPNEWLTKSITEEKVHQLSRRKHDLPSQQQRRKHQITYLAFQAKERELELKNQWAENRMTRRQTQSKYGF
ncbi:proline-rich protein PRCC-like [Limulus polyphemus]|uniref:Proline-rich protein PRCC-like n=1 Tax=Limulus polyphemus TaxID=6850 RepID=A0ABM1BYC0_LIMPO|nr:proline-rich protein PRCC-like [Limulus polyphemus]